LPTSPINPLWGYSDFLEAIQNPKHKEHESMVEWVGGEFDPDKLDIKFINIHLKNLKL